jgi:hypothetical protein
MSTSILTTFNKERHGSIEIMLLQIRAGADRAAGIRISAGPHGQYNSRNLVFLDSEEVIDLSKFLEDAVMHSSREISSVRDSTIIRWRGKDKFSFYTAQGKLGGISIHFGDLGSVWSPEISFTAEETRMIISGIAAARASLERLR